jgi:hypothetical protein
MSQELIYQYEAISPNKADWHDSAAVNIRLITILPGSISDPVCLVIETAELDIKDPPSYEALSYVWGSTKDQVVIYIEANIKFSLKVTKNLNVAIRYLQYQTTSRTVWIDAISIDQANLEERSHQVSRMGDVYRLARHVLAWLGPDEHDGFYALERLNYVGAKVILVDWTKRSLRPSDADSKESHWADRDQPFRISKREVIAITSLLGRAWFERLWIQQEVILARDKTIMMVGELTIPFSIFRNAIACLIWKPKVTKEQNDNLEEPLHEMRYWLGKLDSLLGNDSFHITTLRAFFWQILLL